MSGDAPADMGVTGNAVLLLGFISGSIRAGAMYRPVEADPHAGELTVEHAENGNTYRVAVVQLTGTE